MRGQVYGNAGGGLNNADWAVNADVARIGQTGETRTATLLDKIAARENGPTVIHDVMIPGYRANVDHIIVSGRTVTIIDSKVWKPGRYWTFNGVTRRGWEKFAPGDKKTMALAEAKLNVLLDSQNIAHTFNQSLIAVWPSSTGMPTSFFWMRAVKARVIPASALTRAIGRVRPADARIVAALLPLLAN